MWDRGLYMPIVGNSIVAACDMLLKQGLFNDIVRSASWAIELWSSYLVQAVEKLWLTCYRESRVVFGKG